MENKKIEQLAIDFFYLMPLLKKNVLKPFGQIAKTLTPMQIHILLLLKEKESLPMSEIAVQMDILKQQLTYLTNKLEEHHFIERVQDKKDRRSVKISITPEGIKALNEYKKQALDFIVGKFETLADDEIEKLHTAVQSIYKAIDRL
jgi:DNA-binding MarR family transcriptional regulator